MIKRLAAFDFDGTLMNSPEKEEGKIEWQEKTGQPYPHLGWWGRPESLDLNVFDIKPFPTVLHQLKREQSQPDTFVIVLTSRQEKLRSQVQAVLDANDIHVDKLDMKYDWKDKGQKILNYIKQFPDLTEINVYDDMEEHIIAYEAIKAQLPENIVLNIYHANKGNIALTENVKLKKIIQEEVGNFVDEITHSDIKVIKGWGDSGIEVAGEYQSGGRVIDKSELPDKLYHVTVYKDKVLSDRQLMAKRISRDNIGSGFGGGRIEGISASADMEGAETYYWGIMLATALAKVNDKNQIEQVLDWWINKQEQRIGKDLSKLKEVFFNDFNFQYRGETEENFHNALKWARVAMQNYAQRIDNRLKDPIIVGEGQRLRNLNLNDIAIIIINKNDISDETPIITGTDKNYDSKVLDEIRILGNVPVRDYYKP